MRNRSCGPHGAGAMVTAQHHLLTPNGAEPPNLGQGSCPIVCLFLGFWVLVFLVHIRHNRGSAFMPFLQPYRNTLLTEWTSETLTFSLFLLRALSSSTGWHGRCGQSGHGWGSKFWCKVVAPSSLAGWAQRTLGFLSSFILAFDSPGLS